MAMAVTGPTPGMVCSNLAQRLSFDSSAIWASSAAISSPRFAVWRRMPRHAIRAGRGSSLLSWRISNPLEADFCIEALNEAIHEFGPPEIMNTDQGSQFTSFSWTDRLRRTGVRILMDGKGRFLDNIFIERPWRTLKYECVYLHAWKTGPEAKAGIGKWMTFYNHQRPHSALGGRPPAVVCLPGKDETQPDQQVQRVA